MTSQERHEARYQRRKLRRIQRKQDRTDAIGGIETVAAFHNLYKKGRKCCGGVGWKGSVQNFGLHIFSKTAVNAEQVLGGTWVERDGLHFILTERGKVRQIDAPNIIDRPIHKAFTQDVLLPLYMPCMIWNNGASLPKKGFSFSRQLLENDLHAFYRRYGLNGSIIISDLRKFFPTAPHDTIYQRHKDIILDDKLREIGDRIVSNNREEFGMPLGVEPSQAEMVALPSALDNYMKCQLGMKYFGHYMDDYYILVPPDQNPKEILDIFIRKASEIGLTVSEKKTRIAPIYKPFKYCKAKYLLTETGKVVVRGNRQGMPRARRKIKAFKNKIASGEMTFEDLWASVNGIIAYYKTYDDHNRVLKLRRLFYALFGFSCEKIENFRSRERNRPNEVCGL